MTEMKGLTLLQAQEQVAARVADLYADMDAEVDAPDPDPEVQARDEVLERVCGALSFLENSLAEVSAARDALVKEREGAIREAVAAKTEALRLVRERDERAVSMTDLAQQVEKQRAEKQSAVALANALRAELESVKRAKREMNRQMGAVLDRAEEAADGAGEATPAAPIPG